jgi:hypothetical protein
MPGRQENTYPGAQPPGTVRVVIHVGPIGPKKLFVSPKESEKMAWSLSTIALVLFFLWYGLAEFVPMLKTSMWMKVAAVLALLFVVLTLIKM